MLLPLLSLVSLSLCASAVNVASDPTYSNVSRAFNRRFTITPVAVAFPTSVAQVSAAVAAGTAQNLEVVARSGGHSYIANGLGGNNGALVVDMSKMKQITVRSSNNTALIETGNRLGDIALALSAAGRAMPHGTCSYVGIGGHSGYGGFGFTSRAWGLALDTVKSATVVLGNGSIVTASGSVNTDLYWAIRGASPSFGIATSIEVQTFPAPSSATVFEYKWNNVDIKTAATSISAFQTYVATPNLPQQFGAELVFSAGETKGTLQLGLTGGYYANISSAALDALLAPYLKNLPTPTSKMFIPGPYINSVSVFADPKPLNTSSGPDGFDTFYTKSLMTPESAPMSAKAVTAFATYMANQGFTTKTDWFVEVELYGGSNSAINQVPLDSTAFAKRDTLFTIQFYTSSNATMLPPFPDAGFTFLDGMVDSILSNEPADWNYGAYLNYIDDRLGANATKLYYGSHYPRLEAIKAKVDPKDTFRFPVGL